MSDKSKTGTQTSTPVRRGPRALGVVVAVVAAAAVWVVAVPVLGVDLQVTAGTDEAQLVGPGSVVVASLVAALAGWGLLEVLERVTSRGRTIWTVIATVALAGSMLGPLAGTTAATTVSLAVMHLAVGVVLITALRR